MKIESIASHTLPPDSRAAHFRGRLKTHDAIEVQRGTGGLVKGLIGEQSLCAIYGPSNTGKTFLALDLAEHLSAGLDWCGRRINAARPVLYLAAEGGVSLENRVAAICQEKQELATNQNFHLLSVPINLIQDRDELVRALDFVPGAIFIDTLAQAFQGDENSGREMGEFLSACEKLRDRFRCAVIVIHHTGKDQAKGARGHSSLRAALDTELALDQADGVVTLCATKQRDFPIGGTLHYRLKQVVLGYDDDGDEITSCVIEQCAEPSDSKPLTGKLQVAMQAFDEALRDTGRVRQGQNYPSNTRTISLSEWRAKCAVFGLTGGTSESAERMAFVRAKDAALEANLIRIYNDFAWKVDR